MSEQIEQKSNIEEVTALIYKRIYGLGTLAGLVTVVIALLLYFVEFQAEAPWQLLGYSGAVGFGVILLLVSRFYFSRGNLQLAETLIPVVVFCAFALPNLFVSGLNILLLGSSLIILVITSYALKVKKTGWWALIGVLITAFLILLEFNPPRNRFDIIQSGFWNIFITSIVSGLILAILWQLAISIQHTSVRVRLMISFISFAMIPALISIISIGLWTMENGRNQISNHLRSVSNHKIQLIDKFIEDLHHELDRVITTKELTTYLSGELSESSSIQIYNQLTETLYSFTNEEDDSHFKTMFLIDRNGQIFISSQADLIGENYSTNPFYVEALANGHYTSPLSLDNGEVMMFFSHQLLDENGDLIAIIAGQADTKPLAEIVRDFSNLGDFGESYLLTSSGIVLTETRFPPSPSIVQAPDINTISPFGDDTYTNYTDETVIRNWQYIPTLGAIILTEQNEAAVLSPFINSLVINGSITAIAITVTIIGSVFITRTITQPINTLTKNMTSYNNKQINNIPALKTDDEIGKFSQILHALSTDLYQSMTNLDELVNERTAEITQRSKQLEAAVEIGLAATSIHELDQLLTTASHLISEKLGFYHIGIFLVDNAREYAVLRATNSEGGWRMLTQNHQQKIGEQGGIGLVTHTGEPQINQHIGSSGVYYENPDLPLSRSEITLPLIFEGQVIGALDIHSTEENVFKEEDISVLQVLADQVSAAINNTRQFENLNTTLEAERLVYSVLSEDAWTSVAKQAGVGYTSDKSGVRSTGQSQSPLAKQALQLSKTITPKKLQSGQNNYPIAVPVKVRGGQPIAVIESQKPKENGAWNTDEIQVLEAIAAQLGIALENARLFEQTQNLAQRERIATDVSAKVWSSSDINTILQTAVQELGRALNATEGTIRLRLSETDE